MSQENKSSEKNSNSQQGNTADQHIDLIITKALSTPDTQYALSRNFAEAVANRAMPEEIQTASRADGKGYIIAIAALVSVAFVVACWTLGVAQSLIVQLEPYKTFLAVSLLLLLGIQILDALVVKRRQSML